MSRVVYLVGFDEVHGEAVAGNIMSSFNDVSFRWWPIDQRTSSNPFPGLFEFETDRLTSAIWPRDVPRPYPGDVERQLLEVDPDFIIALMMFDRFKIRAESTSGSLSSATIISHTARVLAYWTSRIADEEPVAAVFSRIPHNFADFLFLVALKRAGIETIVGRSIQIGPSFNSVGNTFGVDFSCLEADEEIEIRDDLLADVARRRRSESPSYMKPVRPAVDLPGFFQQPFSDRQFHRLKQVSLKRLEERLLLLLLRRLKNFRSSLALKRYVREDREMVDECLARGGFLYLPLHLQPEATTSPLVGTLNDQRLFVEAVALAASSLNLKVLVKENPKQVFHYRDDSFWRDIKRIDNVLAVDQSLNSFKLMRSASVVATLNGTAGWEAACNDIPVIAHESAVYKGSPLVFIFSSLVEVETALDQALNADRNAAQSTGIAAFLRGLTAGSVRGLGLNTGRSRDETSVRDYEEVAEISNKFVERLSVVLNHHGFRSG